MDSLPQWDALSQAAQAHLLRSVQAMLDADARCMPCVGDTALWRELTAAGVVQNASDGDGVRLTGPGTCLVLDAMEAALMAERMLVAA